MKRVLFVDDEVEVLNGLQDLLRKQRKVWDMVFVGSGAAALAEFAKTPFDVVVSDMRMAGMDGAELLAAIKARSPRTARIVLSGHAERDAIQRSIPVAHQFLSKPCDREALQAVIERSCQVQDLLHDENLQAIVGKMDKLPSAPKIYMELNAILDNPKTGVGDVARVVEKDPAMSAKVLQIVNSAFFGLAQRMDTVPEAVNYLGVDLVKGLALTAEVFSASSGVASIGGCSMDALQKHALLTARVGKKLVSDPKKATEAFTACLVHDVGELVLGVGMPREFGKVVEKAASTDRPIYELEREALGVTHAEAGAYLLGIWGLPFPIVEAVAFHHAPEQIAQQNSFGLVAAVHVADALVGSFEYRQAQAPADPRLSTAYLERIGVAARLPAWKAMAQEEHRRMAEAG